MNDYLKQELIARAAHADLVLYFLLRDGARVNATALASVTGHAKELFRVALTLELRRGNVVRCPESELRGSGPKDYENIEYQLTNQGVSAAFYTLMRRNPALYVMLLEHRGWADGQAEWAPFGADSIGFHCLNPQHA